MDLTWPQVVAMTLIIFAPLFSSWVILALATNGSLAKRSGRRLRYSVAPSEQTSMLAMSTLIQGGSAGGGAVFAGFLLNLATAYYEFDGGVRMNYSPAPIFMLVCAFGFAVSAGSLAAYLLGKLSEKPISNPWMLLRGIDDAMMDGVRPSRLAMLQSTYHELEGKAATSSLRTMTGLRDRDFWSDAADREGWFSASHDPAGWAGRVYADLTLRNSMRFLAHRHQIAFSTLGVLLVLPVVALAVLPASIPERVMTLFIGLAIGPIGAALLAGRSIVRGSRSELTLAIRMAALHRAVLDKCRERLESLQLRQTQREATQDWVPVLALERWRVYRQAAAATRESSSYLADLANRGRRRRGLPA